MVRLEMKIAIEEILLFDQSIIIEQARFRDYPLGKAFEKQIKTMKDQVKKQIKVLEDYGKHFVESNSEKETLTLSKQK